MDAPKATLTNHIHPIRCPQCDERAYIILRVPDAVKRDGAEVCIFQCVNGHNTKKIRQAIGRFSWQPLVLGRA